MDAFLFMLKGQGHQFTRDPNHAAFNGSNNFTAQDGTAGTTVKSPLTVATSVLPIQPPAGALRLILTAVANDIRISDEPTAAAYYYVLKAGATITVDVANEQLLYVKQDSAGGTLNFLFLYI